MQVRAAQALRQHVLNGNEQHCSAGRKRQQVPVPQVPKQNKGRRASLGGSLAENLPAKVDVGLIPGLGGSHLPKSN